MKILQLMVVLTITSCAGAKESVYIGSTPSHPIVTKFLGIAVTDSVDFIRWRLSIQDGSYSLQCRYGIAKQGTNGFIDEKIVNLSGSVERAKGRMTLRHSNASLVLTELNESLIHLTAGNGSLVPGNAGFGFALSSETPRVTDQLFLPARKITVRDSATFQGRTPCGKISGTSRFNEAGCFKLKWYVVLYTDATGNPSSYRIRGTAFADSNYEKKGSWKIIEKFGRNIYELKLGGSEGSLYLIRVEENILLLSDAAGNVLVGNKDFSYVLSRV